MKILLADDHNVLRKGLRRILEEQPDLEVVGEASDGREAVSLNNVLHPDIVVMDIAMPLMNGLEATRQILQRNTEVNVLILSMYSDENYVVQVLRAGARGYLLKDTAEEDLESVADGVEFVRRMMKHADLVTKREVIPGETVSTREQIKEFIKDQAWGHHASCTCKIGGDNDPEAVLDSSFRVRGVKGLRVVDASVFPSIPGFFVVMPIPQWQ